MLVHFIQWQKIWSNNWYFMLNNMFAELYLLTENPGRIKIDRILFLHFSKYSKHRGVIVDRT